MALSGGLTDYAERHLLGHFLGTETWTAPDLWMALGSTDWGEAGTGGTEVTGGGYARVQVTDWDAVVTETYMATLSTARPRARTQNTNVVTFPASTAAWSIPSPTWGAFFDAATGGNCLYTFGVANLSGPTAVNTAGRQATFAAGSLALHYTDRVFTDAGNYKRGSLYKTWMGHLWRHFIGETALPSRNFHFAIMSAFDEAEVLSNTEATFGGYARISCNGKWTAPTTDSDSRASSTLAENLNFANATSTWGTGWTLVIVNGATGSDWMGAFRFSGRVVNTGDRLVLRPDDLFILQSN